MKKMTFLKLRGWCILFVLALLPFISSGQCINSTSFGTITSDNAGQIQQISGCTYSTEYNTINGLLVGENYIFTATDQGVDKYVSITDASNVSIAHGPSPLIVNAITATTVRLHVSNSAACDGGSVCHVTTVQFLADCPAPVGLGVTNLTTISATANWTGVGPGTAWDLEYGPTGFTQGSGTLVTNLAAATYNFINLTAATTYQFYVRSKCATEDSLWSTPFSFTTNCVTVTAFSENFDAYPSGFNSALPNCWTKGGSLFDINIASGSVAPASAPNYLYMWGYNGETTTFASMPVVSNLAAGTHRLRFRAHEAWNPDRVLEVGYLTDASNVSSYVFIAEVDLGLGAANSQEFVITPGILPATAVRLAFRNGGVPDGSTNAYIDDVNWEAIPTCIEPTDLFVSEITPSSANVAWTAPTPAPASGYEYFLSTSSANPTAATPATGSVLAGITELNLTSLVPATQYYIWVRSVCSVSDIGIWVGSASFKTLCVPVTEYSENFDSYEVFFNGPIPDCWNKGGLGSVYVTFMSSSPMSAPNRMVMTADAFPTPPSESIAAMPVVSNLQANTHRLRFKAYNSFGPDRFLEIGYLTDAADYSTYQFISQVDLQTGPANAQQYIIVPGALPANAVRLVFKNTSIPGDYTEINIDDVKWEPIPSCLEPSAVVTSGVLATTATISWTAPSTAPAGGYEYYLSTSSVEPTAATTPTGSVIAGNTSIAISSLTPSTQYFVWVRSVCSVTATSYWTTSTTFTTPCAAFVPGYTQDFATFTWQGPPSCWEKYGTGTVSTGPSGPTNSGSWQSDGFLNVDFEGAAKINIFNTGVVGWLVSPVFDLTAGNYQLKFDVGATQYASTGPITPTQALGSDDFVYVLMSTDAGATWTALETYSASNTPSHLGTTEVYNIPTVTSSTVKFAFYGTSGTVIDTQDVDFFIDNFIIQSIPTTAPVCATNVVATIAPGCGNDATVITWDASVGSDGYKLTIGTTAGGSDILNNQVIGGLTYSFIGSLNTTYYFKVVPFNVNGDATGCVEQSFTTAATGCFCPSLPTSVDGSGITQLVLGTSTFPISIAAAPFYQDNTATIVPFEQNVLANVQITFNTSFFGYNTYVWIDFNNNYIFETTELVFSGESASTSPNTLDASFTMPATAPLGAHRMRITGADFMPVANPCYSGNYAMTLDYTVNVVQEDLSTGSFDSDNFKFYPNPVTDILNVSYTDMISTVEVFNMLGQQVVSKKVNSTNGQVDMSLLTSGTYIIKVSSEDAVKVIKVVKR
jgi:hypothetical protein